MRVYELETYGKHVIAELSKCANISDYDDETKLKALLLECASEANATVLSVSTHKFEPHGISGIVYLAESHFSVHAFPEKGYVATDFFTCGETTFPIKALNHFKDALGCAFACYNIIERGLPLKDYDGSFGLKLSPIYGYGSVEGNIIID